MGKKYKITEAVNKYEWQNGNSDNREKNSTYEGETIDHSILISC